MGKLTSTVLMGLEPSNRLWLPDDCKKTAHYKRFLPVIISFSDFVNLSCLASSYAIGITSRPKINPQYSLTGQPAFQGLVELSRSGWYMPISQESSA